MQTQPQEQTLSPRQKAARERLAKIEAERAEIAKNRAQREADEADEALTRQAEIALRDEKLVEEFGVPVGTRGIHWELVSTVEGAVIVKRPPRLAYRQFQDLDKATLVKVDELVTKCLAYPTNAKEYHELVDKQPQLSMRCLDAIADLAGYQKKEREGK